MKESLESGDRHQNRTNRREGGSGPDQQTSSCLPLPSLRGTVVTCLTPGLLGCLCSVALTGLA